MDERVLSSPFLFRFYSRQSSVFPGWAHLRSLPIFLWAARCRGRDGPLVLRRSGNASAPGTHERSTMFARPGNIPASVFCHRRRRKPGAFLSLRWHAAHRVSDYPGRGRRQCRNRLPHTSTLGSCGRSRSCYRRGVYRFWQRASALHATRSPVLFDLYDLYGQGLVNCGKIALLSIPDIVPASIRLQGAGAMLFKLMELKWLWADPGEVTSLMILLS